MADEGFELELKDSVEGEYPLIPDGGIVSVIVDEVSIGTPPGGEKQRISFKFIVTEDGDFKDQWLFGSTPTTFSNNPDCKLMSWVRELLGGGDLPVGFKVTHESLKGLEGRAAVNQYARKKDGKMVNGVNDVLRPKSLASASVPFADEEPFRVDAGDWMPGMWGNYPERLLP